MDSQSSAGLDSQLSAHGGLLDACSWVSTRGRKDVAWGRSECIKIAADLFKDLPPNVTEVLKLRATAKQASTLIGKEEHPSWKACTRHETLVTPFVKHVGKVPSTYLIADSLLELDVMCEGMLLTSPTSSRTKAAIALLDAAKLKRVIQHSKKLHRQSLMSNHDAMKRIKRAWQVCGRRSHSTILSNIITDDNTSGFSKALLCCS